MWDWGKNYHQKGVILNKKGVSLYNENMQEFGRNDHKKGVILDNRIGLKKVRDWKWNRPEKMYRIGKKGARFDDPHWLSHKLVLETLKTLKISEY